MQPHPEVELFALKKKFKLIQNVAAGQLSLPGWNVSPCSCVIKMANHHHTEIEN